MASGFTPRRRWRSCCWHVHGLADHGRETRRPWRWAHIAPIARLSVPRWHRDLIVLDGDNGHALAFGPGWTPNGAAPGSHELSVISAHRDTRFRFLQMLWPGDRLHLDGPHGGNDYQVTGHRILDSRHERVPAADSMDGLWLVTCYPIECDRAGRPAALRGSGTSHEPERRRHRIIVNDGNQRRSTRSEFVIGPVPLCRGTCRCGRRPSLCDGRIGTGQSMVFPLTSPTTFVPAQSRRDFCAGVVRAGRSVDRLAHGGGLAQPIALRMAACSLSRSPCAWRRSRHGSPSRGRSPSRRRRCRRRQRRSRRCFPR